MTEKKDNSIVIIPGKQISNEGYKPKFVGRKNEQLATGGYKPTKSQATPKGVVKQEPIAPPKKT